jgi:hypothetical protein
LSKPRDLRDAAKIEKTTTPFHARANGFSVEPEFLSEIEQDMGWGSGEYGHGARTVCARSLSHIQKVSQLDV